MAPLQRGGRGGETVQAKCTFTDCCTMQKELCCADLRYYLLSENFQDLVVGFERLFHGVLEESHFELLLLRWTSWSGKNRLKCPPRTNRGTNRGESLQVHQ